MTPIGLLALFRVHYFNAELNEFTYNVAPLYRTEKSHQEKNKREIKIKE